MSEKTVGGIVINSKLYGELRPEQHQIYDFQQGVVGFSHLNQFALLPYEDTQLFILQSLQEEIGFLLLPSIMSQNSDGFYIDPTTVAELDTESPDDIITFYTLRFIDGQPHINLKAPILITPTKQRGCQYVLKDDQISLCEPLILAGDADARS